MKKDRNNELERVIQEQYSNIAGIEITQNNALEFEHYNNNFHKNDTIHIASVTKSILSLLIGIAIDKGAIQSLEQKVLEFFPEYTIKRGEKTIQNITLEHVLTMTAPYKFKYEPYTKVYSSEDWTKASLDLLGGKGEIGEFKYTTVGLQVLSGILVHATGQPIVDFANEHVFTPLGIKTPHNTRIQNKEEHLAFLKDKSVSGWVVDPKGVNTAGWGLTLTTPDMVKIGQLYSNKGTWKNRIIVSPEWIEESTREHSAWGELSYGYLWWVIQGFENTCYAAIGDGGNIIFVYPENNIIIAITSSFMPRAKDRIELIKNYIFPLLDV